MISSADITSQGEIEKGFLGPLPALGQMLRYLSFSLLSLLGWWKPRRDPIGSLQNPSCTQSEATGGSFASGLSKAALEA